MRNKGIDALKIICAFMITVLHCPFPGTAGILIDSLCRIAVPIFFMISGYFFYLKKERGIPWKNIGKLSFLLILSNLFYFAVIGIINRNNFVAHMKGLFTPSALVDFLLLNHSPLAGHLWYLGAAIYVLLIAGLISRVSSLRKLFYIISPLLLIANVLLGEYSMALFHLEVPVIYTRNFLFCGLPFFMIGMLVNEYDLSSKLRLSWGFLILFGMFTVFCETYVLDIKGTGRDGELYFSTILTALAVFCFVIIKSKAKTPGIIDVLAFAGNKYSLFVYIIQVAVIFMWDTLVAHISRLNLSISYAVLKAYEYAQAIIVFLSSLALAALFSLILSHVGKRK